MSTQVNILHLETSTEICSIAITQNGTIRAEHNSITGFEHSAKGTILVESCLRQAGLHIRDLAAVSISQGPGSYTGLRVGFAMAKGFCFAYNIPLICVPTLKALANGVEDRQEAEIITPMLDARRMEVYTESFDSALKTLSPLEALVLDEDTFNKKYGKNKFNLFIGDGAHKVEKWLREGQDRIIDKRCRAADQMQLAHFMYQNEAFSDIAYSVPLYLKPPNITISKKNLLS